MRTFDDSLRDILELLGDNAASQNVDIYRDCHFGYKINEQHRSFSIEKPTDGSIKKSFDIKNEEKVQLNDYLFILVSRPAGTEEKVPLEFEVNLDEIAIDDKLIHDFDLCGIVAHKDYHYIFFKKVKQQWYIINDEWCFQISEEQVRCLEGGEEKDTYALRSNMDNEPWLSDLLFYCRKGKSIL